MLTWSDDNTLFIAIKQNKKRREMDSMQHVSSLPVVTFHSWYMSHTQPEPLHQLIMSHLFAIHDVSCRLSRDNAIFFVHESIFFFDAKMTNWKNQNRIAQKNEIMRFRKWLFSLVGVRTWLKHSAFREFCFSLLYRFAIFFVGNYFF